MKNMVRKSALFMLAQFVFIGAAIADDKVVEKPVVADTFDKFTQMVEDIRSEMGVGGRYEFIRPADKAKVEVDLGSMSAMLQKKGSVSSLAQGERVQLFNTQEHVNGILTHSDRNRLICERRAPIGTNIPVTTCKTVAEVEKARNDSQKYMDEHAKDAGINSAAMHRQSGGG